MQKEHRWLKSAIVASVEVQVAMPWNRQNRSRPEAMKAPVVQPVQARKPSMAAR